MDNAEQRAEDVSGWNFNKKDNKAETTTTKKQYDYNLWISLKPNVNPPTKRKIKVRFVSQPIHYGMHWLAFKPLLEIQKQRDPNNAALARKKYNPVKTAYQDFKDRPKDAAWFEGGWQPSVRHASWVIDREDGHLKILEGSKDIFQPVGEWAEDSKINPAGENGTDWTITVDVDQGGKTQIISVLPGMPQPLTEQERVILQENTMVLEKILKIKDWQEIREMWLELPDDKKYNPKDPKCANKVFDDDERQRVLKRFEDVDKMMYEEHEANKKQDNNSHNAVNDTTTHTASNQSDGNQSHTQSHAQGHSQSDDSQNNADEGHNDAMQDDAMQDDAMQDDAMQDDAMQNDVDNTENMDDDYNIGNDYDDIPF